MATTATEEAEDASGTAAAPDAGGAQRRFAHRVSTPAQAAIRARHNDDIGIAADTAASPA